MIPFTCFADVYDDLSIDFEKLKIMMHSKGSPAPRVKYIMNSFNKYASFLQLKAEVTIREVLSDADKSKIQLRSKENLPALIAINKACIANSLKFLNILQSKYLEVDNIKEYASVMICYSYIRTTSTEIDIFLWENRKYLKEKNKYDEIWKIRDNAAQVLDDVGHQSNRYFKFLLFEDNRS
jgi:hypothetical protein